MKTFNYLKQNWLTGLIKLAVIVLLFFFSCFLLNFILVPPLASSTIGTIMADELEEQENIDVVFLGSSRTFRSIDAPNISNAIGKNTFNIAFEYANYYTSYYLLEEIYKNNKLETLFIEMSTTNFTRETSTEDIYVYKTLTGETQKEFEKGLGENYIDFDLFEFTNFMKCFSDGRFIPNIKIKISGNDKVGEAISTYNSKYLGKGFLYADAKIEDEAKLSLPVTYFNNGKLWDGADEKQFEYFNKILNFCKENKIQVILYSPPYPQVITEKHLKELEKFDLFTEEIANENNLLLLNFSKIKKEHIELSSEYFYNANHCNGECANNLAPIISNIYQNISTNTYNNDYWFYDTYETMMSDYSIN